MMKRICQRAKSYVQNKRLSDRTTRYILSY